MREDDWCTIEEMVTRHEGAASAELLRFWAAHPAQETMVFRDAEDAPLGFLLTVALEQCTAADGERDPAVARSLVYLRNHAPLRPGERASLFRFWMASGSYQGISPVQSEIAVEMVRHYLTAPNLAYTFMPCADPDFWYAICRYADLERIEAADYTVGGQTYGAYGHDWRQVPVADWLKLLAEREVARGRGTVERTVVVEPRVTLSRPEFEEAVRDALRHYKQADRLQANPLLRARLLQTRLDRDRDAGLNAAVAALRALLEEAAAEMRDDRRTRKYYRALYHTYLQPAPTQEMAAEIVDVPFGTFRRHLRRALERVTERLWQEEIGEQS